MYDHTTVSFRTFYHTGNSDHVVAVVGSSICLGSWNPAKSLILKEEAETGTWQAETRLQVGGSFEWKLAVLDRRHERIVKWEDVPNRVLSVGKVSLDVEAPWNAKETITSQASTSSDNEISSISTSLNSIVIKSLPAINSPTNREAPSVSVCFKIRFVPEAYNEVVAVSGSNRHLGTWNPNRAIVCKPFGTESTWVGNTTLPGNAMYEWKMVCLDRVSRHIVRWEAGQNRRTFVGQSSLEVVAPWCVKEVTRYARNPSVIFTPLERKSSDVDCTAEQNNNNSTHKDNDNTTHKNNDNNTNKNTDNSTHENNDNSTHENNDTINSIDDVKNENNNNNAQTISEDRRLRVDFTILHDVSNTDLVLCVCGSCKSLGNWGTENALRLKQRPRDTMWRGTIYMPPQSRFEWKLVMLNQGVEVWEPHDNRVVQLSTSSIDILVTWNGKEFIDLIPASLSDFVKITFKVRYQLQDDEVLVVTGNSGTLGAWNLKEALTLKNQHNENCWSAEHVFVVDEIVEYKLAVLDKYSLVARRWEAYPNRVLHVGRTSWEVIIPWEQREIARDDHPRQGEKGARMNMRQTLEQCFFFCCSEAMDYDFDEDDQGEMSDTPHSYVETTPPDTVSVQFATNYSPEHTHHVVAIAGSCDSLGNWDVSKAARFDSGTEPGNWQLMKLLPIDVTVTWKLLIIDKVTRKAVRWEERENREIHIKRTGVEINADWNEVAVVKPMEVRGVPLYSCTTSYSNTQNSENLSNEVVTATIKTQYECRQEECVLAVLGSIKELGNWEPERAVQMDNLGTRLSICSPRAGLAGNRSAARAETITDEITWYCTVSLPINTAIFWKLALMDKRTSRVIKWEETRDRVMKIRKRGLAINVPWNKAETTDSVPACPACVSEKTETTDIVPACPACVSEKAGANPGLRSVMKSHSAQFRSKKSVHFPNDPVAECRMYVKNKCVTQCLSENCHGETGVSRKPGCDGNNNSVVIFSCSYIMAVYACVSVLSCL